MEEREKLTKEEFCKAIRTSEACWIFKNMKEKDDGNFWRTDDEYYFDNGVDSIRKFKDMPQYKEIWSAYRRYDGSYGLWNTWCDYDI